MKQLFCLLLLFIFISSCKDIEKRQISSLIQEWEGKEIVFPVNPVFINQDGDTVIFNYSNSKYRILLYIDSIGCTSCKLRLPQWKEFIQELNSFKRNEVAFIFYSHQKNKKELSYIVKRDDFIYPICIDQQSEFYRLNKIPNNSSFQTFLLDNKNRVMAIGNPIHNPKIRDLYIQIIQGDKGHNNKKNARTEVNIDKQIISLGDFDWEVKQKIVFQLRSMGNTPLVINDVITSCGCTSVEYTKEPVRPRKSIALNITYQAEHPEHFDKTITVYCNASSSPIQLKISGNAQ